MHGAPMKKLLALFMLMLFAPDAMAQIPDWRKSWDELLLKVFFAELCSRDALLGQLDDYAEVQRGLLAEYEAISPATRYGALTLEYGLELMPVRLAWIEKARRELAR